MILMPNILLSDEFVEFSSKITSLHDNKKEANAEFKKLFEKHKADMKKLDDEANNLQNDFNKWVSGETENNEKVVTEKSK